MIICYLLFSLALCVFLDRYFEFCMNIVNGSRRKHLIPGRSKRHIWLHKHRGSHHRSKGRQSIRRSKGRSSQHIRKLHKEERHQPQAQHQQTSFLGICSLRKSKGKLHRCRGSQSIHRSRGQHSHKLHTEGQHQLLAQHQQTSCRNHHHHKQRKQKDKQQRCPC